MDKFKFLRPSLKDMLLNCCLKFKSTRITRGVGFLRLYPFCELQSAFNGISHYKLFAIFLHNPRGLSCHILWAEVHANHGLKNSNVIRDKAFRKQLSYYCFNSKGDNFNESTLRCCQILTIHQRQNVWQYVLWAMDGPLIYLSCFS